MKQPFNHQSDSKLSPIVAIHGSASNGAFWDGLTKHYASNRIVLTPDLEGYGKADHRTTNPNATLTARAEPILRSIDTLGQEIHLVAHSFGSAIALEIVKTIPEKIRSLTLYEPVLPALLRDSEQADDMELLGDLLALSDIIRGTAPMVAMETFINFWNEPTAWDRLPNTTRQKLAELAPIVYQDFIEAYFNVVPDTFNQIKFKRPVTMLLGACTNNHAKRMANILLQQFPHALTETFEALGHMGPLTHPNIVHASITQHIERAETHHASN